MKQITILIYMRHDGVYINFTASRIPDLDKGCQRLCRWIIPDSRVKRIERIKNLPTSVQPLKGGLKRVSPRLVYKRDNLKGGCAKRLTELGSRILVFGPIIERQIRKCGCDDLR